MWWEDEREDRREVASALSRIAELPPQALLGYGMAYLNGDQVAVLVIAPRSRDPRPRFWEQTSRSRLGGTLVRWLAQRMVEPPLPEVGPNRPIAAGDLGRYPELGDLRFRRYTGLGAAVALLRHWVQARRNTTLRAPTSQGLSIGLADSSTRSELSDLGIEAPVRVWYWQEPSFTRSRRIFGRDGGRFGSRGIGVQPDERNPLVCTAGHLGVSVDEVVHESRGRFRGRRVLGTAVTSFDPRRPEEVDAAKPVDLLAVETRERLAMDMVPLVHPESPAEFTLCEWNGATSGLARGELVGALRSITVEGVTLRNCWYISSDCRGGDSGALVRTVGDVAILGQVVGSRGPVGPGRSGTGTVVQDAQTLVTCLTDALGVQQFQTGVVAG